MTSFTPYSNTESVSACENTLQPEAGVNETNSKPSEISNIISKVVRGQIKIPNVQR